MNRALGNGIVEQQNDRNDVVVGWSALSNVSDGMTGHNMAERIGHQFDPFGRDLQRHFGWLAFHFFALKVPVDWF